MGGKIALGLAQPAFEFRGEDHAGGIAHIGQIQAADSSADIAAKQQGE